MPNEWEFEDVRTVINAVHCICWSYHSSLVLRNQAALSDMKMLIDQVANLELPDEKALKMMKSLYQRSIT
jgi:hypothetical protein